MSNLFLTLVIAFVIIVLALASLAIGWLITGKTKLERGACGKNPAQKKDEACNSICSLCSTPIPPSTHFEEKEKAEEEDEESENEGSEKSTPLTPSNYDNNEDNDDSSSN